MELTAELREDLIEKLQTQILKEQETKAILSKVDDTLKTSFAIDVFLIQKTIEEIKKALKENQLDF